jgi:hypothetical protein
MATELNRFPEEVRKEMVEKSELYKPNEEIYKYGYFDGHNRCDHALLRAQEQRSVCLRNAFNTIRCFAEPSLDPEQFEAFEQLERTLTERYGK